MIRCFFLQSRLNPKVVPTISKITFLKFLEFIARKFEIQRKNSKNVTHRTVLKNIFLSIFFIVLLSYKGLINIPCGVNID
jgi:hypothetical protein